MVTEFKDVQQSDESTYAEPHHYTVMSGHFKTPADLHRKRNLCYVLNRKLVDPRDGLDVLHKKISFHGDVIFVSSVVRPVT